MPAGIGNVAAASTAATAAQAAAPAPQPKPATATLPAPSKPAATTAPAAPRAAAPKAPAAPKAAPAKPTTTGPGVGPLTYGQSYQGGWSSADFAYDNLGQSDATDIAPFEEFPTSPTTPGEGTSFYRERMAAIRENPPVGAGNVRAPKEAGRIPVPARYGLPETTVFSTPTQYPRDFQSVAEFRDYAQQLGGRLRDAEQSATEAETALRDAALRDTTTRDELKQLYDEKLKKLRTVAGLRESLRVAGVSAQDLPTVMRHAAEREY